MNAINPSTLSFTIKLESEDYAPEDSEWQEECYKFYLQLKNALNIGTVEPLKVENKEKGYRAGWSEFFNYLLVSVPAHAIGHAALAFIIHYRENKKGIKIGLECSDGCSFFPRFSFRPKDINKLINNDKLHNELCANCLDKQCPDECFIKQQADHQRSDKI